MISDTVTARYKLAIINAAEAAFRICYFHTFLLYYFILVHRPRFFTFPVKILIRTVKNFARVLFSMYST